MAKDGPVSFVADPSAVQTAGMHASAGQTVVFGAAVIHNAGRSEATLTRARLVGDVRRSAAAVSQVRVVDLSRHPTTVGAGQWPIRPWTARSVPAKGFALAAGARAELLFVVQVHKTGVWTWPRTKVEYSVGDQNYQGTVSLGFQICPTRRDSC